MQKLTRVLMVLALLAGLSVVPSLDPNCLIQTHPEGCAKQPPPPGFGVAAAAADVIRDPGCGIYYPCVHCTVIYEETGCIWHQCDNGEAWRDCSAWEFQQGAQPPSDPPS